MSNADNKKTNNNKTEKARLTKDELLALQHTKNLKLLEMGGFDAKVLITNTVESKELLSKFVTLDAVSKKSRELVGNKLSIEKFTKLNDLFTKINSLIDEVIEFGSDEGLTFDPREQKFSVLKPRLIKLLEEGKNSSDISREFKLNVAKVESWIKLLDSENNNELKNSVDISKVELPLKAETPSKASAKTEKAS